MSDKPRYFTDQNGNYQGAWSDGAKPENIAHLIEVATPPVSAADLWNGHVWVPVAVIDAAVSEIRATIETITTPQLVALLIAKGIISADDFK